MRSSRCRRTPGSTLLFQGRSFFGVSKVVNADDRNSLYSGTTLHGLQFVNEKRSQPTTYYVMPGPLGDVFDDLRARSEGAAIGVVGLGSGTIAAYAEPTDSLTYFEIDPLVVGLASDPRYFSYLHDTPAPTTVVEGDGRLSLATWPSASLDVLVLDAFSSDSVPPHLLTAEAIETYVRTLKPGGVLAFNLSNRYYDLGGRSRRDGSASWPRRAAARIPPDCRRDRPARGDRFHLGRGRRDHRCRSVRGSGMGSD